jgi:hypothetical protein
VACVRADASPNEVLHMASAQPYHHSCQVHLQPMRGRSPSQLLSIPCGVDNPASRGTSDQPGK